MEPAGAEEPEVAMHTGGTACGDSAQRKPDTGLVGERVCVLTGSPVQPF